MTPLRIGSLRKNLLLLVLLSMLPALGIILYAGLRDRDRAIREAETDALRLVESMADIQEKIAYGVKQVLAITSRLPEVRSGDPGAGKVLREIAGLNPSFGAVLLWNLRGENLAASDPLPPDAISASDRKYFRDAVQSLDFSAGEYVLSRISGESRLHYSHPVFGANGELLGILSLALKLNTFAAIYEKAGLPPDSNIALFDHKGIRLYRFPEQEKIFPLGAPIQKHIWARASGPVETGTVTGAGSDGIRRIYAFQRLRLTTLSPPYMYLFVGIPEERALAPANASLRLNLALMLSAALLALGTAWVFGRMTIGRTVGILLSATRRVGQGDLQARSGLDARHGELGRLGEAFDSMAEALSLDMSKRAKVEEQLRQARDFLEQRVAERTLDLRRAADFLRAARDQAQSANRMKTQFMANVSHELRTPLNPIIAATELILDAPMDPEQRDLLQGVHASARRLHAMIEELLEIVELEDYTPVNQDLSLHSVCELFVRELGDKARAKGLDVVVACEPEREEAIFVDVRLLRLALVKLGENAIKFTDAGKVALEVSRACLDGQGCEVCLTVLDTGIGMPEDSIREIAAGFTQADHYLTRRHGGLGLGLALVRKAVALMRGRLEVASEPGKGSRFTLALPGAQAEAPPAA